MVRDRPTASREQDSSSTSAALISLTPTTLHSRPQATRVLALKRCLFSLLLALFVTHVTLLRTSRCRHSFSNSPGLLRQEGSQKHPPCAGHTARGKNKERSASQLLLQQRTALRSFTATYIYPWQIISAADTHIPSVGNEARRLKPSLTPRYPQFQWGTGQLPCPRWDHSAGDAHP